MCDSILACLTRSSLCSFIDCFLGMGQEAWKFESCFQEAWKFEANYCKRSLGHASSIIWNRFGESWVWTASGTKLAVCASCVFCANARCRVRIEMSAQVVTVIIFELELSEETVSAKFAFEASLITKCAVGALGVGFLSMHHRDGSSHSRDLLPAYASLPTWLTLREFNLYQIHLLSKSYYHDLVICYFSFRDCRISSQARHHFLWISPVRLDRYWVANCTDWHGGSKSQTFTN